MKITPSQTGPHKGGRLVCGIPLPLWILACLLELAAHAVTFAVPAREPTPGHPLETENCSHQRSGNLLVTKMTIGTGFQATRLFEARRAGRIGQPFANRFFYQLGNM